MFTIDIPGFGTAQIEHLVCDYCGALSVDGIMVPGVKERFDRLSEFVKIHILTADTHNRAALKLKGTKCNLHLLPDSDQDVQKEVYVIRLGADGVIAIGNGANDRKMLAQWWINRSKRLSMF